MTRAVAPCPVWIVTVLGLCLSAAAAPATAPRPLRELDDVPAPPADRVVAIVGATLVDGTGGPAVPDSAVVVRGDKIIAAGPRSKVPAPAGAEVVDAAGLTLLPGLIDSHFHLDNRDDRPGVFLRHGVTAVRDPGAYIEAYARVRAAAKAGEPIPRLFLTGPHLDCPPPAFPKDAVLVTTPDEVRAAVNRAADAGAVAIKVYFRLAPELIPVATAAAHARGVPVTAHLELVPAVDAIAAGVDGIEHVTSFGTSLAEPEVARRHEAAVRASNAARGEGRFELWAGLDFTDPARCPRLKPTLDVAVSHHVVLCPTLAVFELRAGDKKATPAKVRAYENMLKFTGLYHRAGGTVVVGSHSEVPHAEYGWAYARECELLVEAGLTPAEVIVAATLNNARYHRSAERLGSVEPGKQADLLLVAGDPLKDISALRQVRRVMLNGVWVNLNPAKPTTREMLKPVAPSGTRPADR
ncbi:MAG TPA: amidohydrolase family protein [Humisphaera sp.]